MSKILTIVITENQYSILMQCMDSAPIQEENILDYKTVKRKVEYAWSVAPRTPGSRN